LNKFGNKGMIKFRQCENCQSVKALHTDVGGVSVNLCSDCDSKIFHQCLGKTDKQIRNMFWSYN
jgi:hypothetical protein